ncbi:FAD-dependent monooxygenase [Dictyobacter aurantiacus]|uniref:FAD-dependent oxidoreductase n=1 Tax=Dictyobacter aurantiacus TaxID=1936993 RepID=A0A401ZD87_9CHLR|nr:FAD-dependent monooxygenase [Dictyobacter aurantiacus]GCE04837.1 FAD-dependent oxidoreductase [Dictyobacter aurantiacus]
MNTSSQHSDRIETTPVLIVGGGLVGLSASLFLSRHGISSLLVERHPGTAIHPRATGFMPPTMEMFRFAGIEEEIRKIEPEIPQGTNVPFLESLVGQELDCLQEDIDSLFTDPSSPVRGSAIAQDVLEPVLRSQAERLGGDLRFNTELVTFEQGTDGVIATIRRRNSQETSTVHARYAIIADGSQSPIRKQLGIGQHGLGSMGTFISMIFEADLMELFHKRHAIMCFLSNETITIGSFVPYAGSSVRPDLFRLDVGYDADEETLADYPEERCIQLIRAAVGISDLPVKLKTTLTWEMNALVADRFQLERAFLVGDAARTQPPSGGLGGNTGIAEAYNLSWKLAAVLRGEAGEQLLTTYDQERRPIADYTAEQVALLSQQRQNEGSSGITVDARTINGGYRYRDGAFVHEAGDEQLPLAQQAQRWQGQPGTRAPHLMLKQEEKSVSTRDLFGFHPVLFVGADGQHWKKAARNVQDQLHIALDCYQIAPHAGDLIDAENRFCDMYGIPTTGAVLVRPDGFIGWRSKDAIEHELEAQQTLTQALSSLLFH